MAEIFNKTTIFNGAEESDWLTDHELSLIIQALENDVPDFVTDRLINANLIGKIARVRAESR